MAERSARVPVREEHVRVAKRTRATGKVRVTRTVRERTALIDEPLAADVVGVDRVPIDRFVEGPIPDRYDGDTLVISVLEEVTVVEKRLRLKEELRITKRRVHTRRPQTVTLRSEEATVERVDASGRIIHAHSTPPAVPARGGKDVKDDRGIVPGQERSGARGTDADERRVRAARDSRPRRDEPSAHRPARRG